jgi:hypothetical protein
MNVETRIPKPQLELQKRMAASYAELNKIANIKLVGRNTSLLYATIGISLGITANTVANYVIGLSKSGNGYLIDALIKEFEKLPTLTAEK